MDNFRYKQITCERNLSTTGFSQGVCKYIYRMSQNQQINLNKSYIRLRCRLSKTDNDFLGKQDLIAPNYLLGHAIFRQMYHCINGVEVGNIQQYVGQIGALRTRTYFNKSMQDKYLASTNFAKPSFEDRQNDILENGYDAPRSTQEQSFKELIQNDGVHVLGSETLEVKVADETLVEYNGAVDLEETQISVGDILLFKNEDEPVERYIKIINADDITIDDRGIPSFGVTDIENNFCFIKTTGTKPSKRATTFELCFKPPMGIWYNDSWMPAHDMELKLYPHVEGTYQSMAIQSLDSNKLLSNYKFEVDDMILYVAVKDEKHPDGDYRGDYEEMRAQVQNITTTSSVEYNFVVNRNSHKFTILFQDENVENNTLYSSTLFKIRNDEQLSLSRYYLQYNGRVQPDPYPNLSKTFDVDYLTQRYLESLHYGDSINLEDVESQEDWLEAGPYFTHSFGRSPKLTEKLTVSTQFNENAFGTGNDEHRPNLMVIDHFIRSYIMKVSNGRIVEVKADTVN